ncbi:exonuclease domain-containing protein [Gulosibacter faecalis]|uniref:Exonuclease domain-containing protein n=1 Tax=Gulosibacter faecalis TaxID=272240 RepID=A0ABW5UZG6_9MICO|nr:exonuclease domain-containing protein [Gulosibacter faecalis]
MSWTNRVAVFDTETTGTNPLEARIVTAFVGMIDGAGELERGTDWLADPGVEIPEPAVEVHGITTEMAREEGEPAPVVLQKITASLEWIVRNNIALVVYNAPYDLTLLQAECARHNLPMPQLGKVVVDPLIVDKQVDRYRKGGRKLGTTAEAYGVELFDAHDASADAVAAGRVAVAIARKYPDVVDVPLDQLFDAQVAWAAEQAEDFEQYMRRQRDPNFTADRGWPLRTGA